MCECVPQKPKSAFEIDKHNYTTTTVCLCVPEQWKCTRHEHKKSESGNLLGSQALWLVSAWLQFSDIRCCQIHHCR